MARIVIAYDRSPGSMSEYMEDAEVITSLIRDFNIVVKIGLEAMTASRDRHGKPFTPNIGELMRMLVAECNGSILWDAKYKDIGNTVQRAIANIAGSVHAVTVHADRKAEWLASIVSARDVAAGANPRR
jgi:orotidine-5'-phosphate decarboxylase